MKKVNIKDVLNKIKTGDFLMACRIPLGYLPGLPILKIKNGRLCLVIPYLKYKITGVVDKTLVYPIRYIITVTLPDIKVIGYSDLKYENTFEKLDFSKPIGLFRHDKVKNLDKKQFQAKKAELMSEYDKVINALIFDDEYYQEDEEKMRQLLQLILEPSLMPIYKALDMDFYRKYLAEEDKNE